MEQDLKKLLDDFYGESRGDDHKEEIVEFIVNYASEIQLIFDMNNLGV